MSFTVNYDVGELYWYDAYVVHLSEAADAVLRYKLNASHPNLRFATKVKGTNRNPLSYALKQLGRVGFSCSSLSAAVKKFVS